MNCWIWIWSKSLNCRRVKCTSTCTYVLLTVTNNPAPVFVSPFWGVAFSRARAKNTHSTVLQHTHGIRIRICSDLSISVCAPTKQMGWQIIARVATDPSVGQNRDSKCVLYVRTVLHTGTQTSPRPPPPAGVHSQT